MTHDVIHGDCRAELKKLPAASFDAVVTDPPAGIAFMGKEWDASKGGRREWVEWLAGIMAECLRLTKPGGRLLCWAIPRTAHWTATAVEDAGWLIENKVYHLFGTGFPKGKGQLKPACEEWVLARKPGGRVLPLGIDACRIPLDEARAEWVKKYSGREYGDRGEAVYGGGAGLGRSKTGGTLAGRYPANVVHDGSDEVTEAFAAFGEKTSGKAGKDGLHRRNTAKFRNTYSPMKGQTVDGSVLYGDTGTAARFFYCAKASKSERGKANTHPTVKPLALMRWLVRLVTPPGGRVLDPFAGSGTTLLAAEMEGRAAVGIEQDAGYVDIIRARLAEQRKADGLFAEVARGQ